MDKFSGKLQKLNLPRAKDWFWDIQNLDERVLRTACLHEYVRETKCLMDRVNKIDTLMDEHRLTAADCHALLRFRTERPQFRDLEWVADSSDKKFESWMLLIRELEELADLIAPLSPFSLLGRGLKYVSYLSLDPKDGRRRDLLATLMPWHEPERLNPLANPCKIEGGVAKLSSTNARMFACTRSCWIAEVQSIARGTFIEMEHPDGYKDNPSLFEYLSFRAAHGSNSPITRYTCFFAKSSVLKSFHPLAIARALTCSGTSAERLHTMGFYRVTDKVLYRHPNIVLKNNPDNFGALSGSRYILFAVTRSRNLRGAVVDIAEILGKMKRDLKTSILADPKRIYRFKPNRLFYETALASVAALRMGHSISTDQFDLVIELLNELSKEDKKKIRIPYSDRSTVRESLAKYKFHASRIFPMLSASQRTPVSSQTSWTIK